MSIIDTLKGIFVTPGADDYEYDEIEHDDGYNSNSNSNSNNRSNNTSRRRPNQYDEPVYGGNVVDVPEIPSNHYHRPSQSRANVMKPQQSEAIVIHPKDMGDAHDIGVHVKQNRLVIVDLTGLASDMARRIVDYLSGVAHTIEGKTVRINNGIFTISPPSFHVSEETSRLSSNNHDNEFGPTSPFR